jgi:Pyruvate/2-oxoacid:ferredoxin oxidoreductase delta subunit
LDKGYPVTSLRGELQAASSPADSVLVLGCFMGTPDQVEGLRFQQIEGMDARAVVETADKLQAETGAAKSGAWKPWFPVIDFARCTNCMQCLSFCLFDVYGVSSDRRIEVRNQDNCKTDCPACSRVCPEVAIMFPKYRHGPINGDQVSADDMRREAMKVDISALLGGDIYSMLRDRSEKAKSRFSKERDDERALKERQNCLLKLQKEMDIPMEVLASLPSPDEIRVKAEQAAARAREAQQHNASPGVS